MKIAGYIVQQKNVFHLGRKKEYHEWELFNKKIYLTQEIAEQAYNNCPYGGGSSGYNMEGRIIPVYFDENEIIKTIKK